MVDAYELSHDVPVFEDGVGGFFVGLAVVVGVFSAVLGVVVVLSGSEVERQASQENGRQEVVDKIFFHLSVFLFITYINPKFHFLTV
ncbi:MAG: hypothetical protein IKS26_01880 [Paludibacteraceae bacterium]|nr:hypothetical protein [Paludibacteraceae bacterium]